MVAAQKKASVEKSVKAPGDFGYFAAMANVANARLSTGPRTPEGKLKSSQNALKHGFRATHALMDEDPEKIEREHALFVQSFCPRNAAAKAAVDLAFRSKRQLERILGAEDARIALLQDQFHARLQRDRHRFVEKGKIEFDIDPVRGVAFLCSTIMGLDTLMPLVEGLGRDLENGVWTPTHSAKLLALEGVEEKSDPLTDTVTGLADRIASARATLIRLDPESPLDRDERRAAEKVLDESLAAVERHKPALAKRLSQARQNLIQEREHAIRGESTQLRRLMDSLKGDRGPEESLLQRYKSQALRDFHRALELACRLCGYKASEARSPLSVEESPENPVYRHANDRMVQGEAARRAPNEPESGRADSSEKRDRPTPGTNVRGTPDR